MAQHTSFPSLSTGIVILAGGKSSRMGGNNKALCLLKGRPLLTHILERVKHQSPVILLNVNDTSKDWSAFNLPIQPDTLTDFPGPLGGILAAMEWFERHHPEISDIVSIPADSPFIPENLVEHILAARARAHSVLATAFSCGRAHPAIGLWPVALKKALQKTLSEEHIHRIIRFTERYSLALAEYKPVPFDPFININTPEELEKANHLINMLKT